MSSLEIIGWIVIGLFVLQLALLGLWLVVSLVGAVLVGVKEWIQKWWRRYHVWKESKRRGEPIPSEITISPDVIFGPDGYQVY